MELLLSSLTNTDALIRNYKDTCLENNRLKKTLQSLNETNVQINRLYQIEKEKSASLLGVKCRLDARIKDQEEEIDRLRHKHLNQDTLHTQSIAELEQRLEKEVSRKQTQYIDLCRSFLSQGNILEEQNLSTTSLRRKLKRVTEVLKQQGDKFADTKIVLPKRRTHDKPKDVRTVGTITDVSGAIGPPICNKLTCDKATMTSILTSTATRSTCTSAFIKKVDVGISTNMANRSSHVRNIFSETLPVPGLLSPIKSLKSTTTASQTTKEYHNQGTITQLQNVCKEISYNKGPTHTLNPFVPMASGHGTDSGFASPVRTKEEFYDMFSNSDNTFSQSMLKSTNINRDLLRLWLVLGESMFTMIGNGRIFDESAVTDMNLVNNAQLPKNSDGNMFGEQFYKLRDQLVKLNQPKAPSECDEPNENGNETYFSDNDTSFNDLNSLDTHHFSMPESKPSIRLPGGFLSEPNQTVSGEEANPSRFEASVRPASACNAASNTEEESEEPKRMDQLSSAKAKKRSKQIQSLFGPNKRTKISEMVSLNINILSNYVKRDILSILLKVHFNYTCKLMDNSS